MKISSALIVGKNLLSKAGIPQPLRESKLIICYVLDVNINNSLLDIEKKITESTKEYGKSLEKIANDKKLKMISKKDRKTLKKLANLMKEDK